MVGFVFALTELFRYTVPELWDKMCTARLFLQGSTYLHLNCTWVRSSPTNHSWHQKTRYTGLSDGEDRISLRSLVLTQYRSVIHRRTDGRTDGFADLGPTCVCLRRSVCLEFTSWSSTLNHRQLQTLVKDISVWADVTCSVLETLIVLMMRNTSLYLLTYLLTYFLLPKLNEISVIDFWDMVFTRFSGRTDSLTDGQTRIHNAFGTERFRWQKDKIQW